MNSVQVVKQTWLKPLMPLMFYLKSYLIEAQCPVITQLRESTELGNGSRLVYQISTAQSFLVQNKVLHLCLFLCVRRKREPRYRRHGPLAES